MDYDIALQRADMAASFVEHPYWPIVARMLSGTIQSETEELLAGDAHKDVNRASVAMCRKVLNMPFFDIEQGKAASAEYKRVQSNLLRRRGSQSDLASREVQ